jgi:hypothetical protein
MLTVAGLQFLRYSCLLRSQHNNRKSLRLWQLSRGEEGIVFEHFFRISSPATIADDLSVLVRNDMSVRSMGF